MGLSLFNFDYLEFALNSLLEKILKYEDSNFILCLCTFFVTFIDVLSNRNKSLIPNPLNGL